MGYPPIRIKPYSSICGVDVKPVLASWILASPALRSVAILTRGARSSSELNPKSFAEAESD